jgi:hypothetical protein
MVAKNRTGKRPRHFFQERLPRLAQGGWILVSQRQEADIVVMVESLDLVRELDRVAIPVVDELPGDAMESPT